MLTFIRFFYKILYIITKQYKYFELFLLKVLKEKIIVI